MIELETLAARPESTLNFLSDVSREAEGRITSRIILEETGVIIKNMPIGGEEGLDSVLAFMPMLKEGFALSLKSDEVEKGQVADILKITKPQTLADFLPELGFTLHSRIIKNDPRLSIFRHGLATLSVLSQISKVDSTQVEAGIPGISEWPYRLDKENIWFTLSEIEDTTRKMILDRRNLSGRSAEIRALHFFAVGKYLAENLK